MNLITITDSNNRQHIFEMDKFDYLTPEYGNDNATRVCVDRSWFHIELDSNAVTAQMLKQT